MVQGGMDPFQNQRAAFQGLDLKGKWDMGRGRGGSLRSGVSAAVSGAYSAQCHLTFLIASEAGVLWVRTTRAWGGRWRAPIPAWPRQNSTSAQFTSKVSEPSITQCCYASSPSQRPNQNPNWTGQEDMTKKGGCLRDPGKIRGDLASSVS